MNKPKQQFSSSKSIGARDNRDIASYLFELDDKEGAMALLAGGSQGASISSMAGYKPAWKDTGVIVGFLEPGNISSTATPVSATQIVADENLVGERIKITLDRFYVRAYPGFGEHHILCEYCGKNQVKRENGKKSSTEDMRFALNVHANDNSPAGVQGQPLFLGVAVGKDGLAFEGRTVNVKSETDEKILKILNSSAVKTGLSLMTTAQPALKPFVGLTGALVDATVGKKNVQVHSFFLGLDFSDNTSSVKLRYGNYIVVQSDDENWDWNDYQWNGSVNLLNNKRTGNPVDANYSVLGITPFSDQ